jgi:hypothetical protein
VQIGDPFARLLWSHLTSRALKTRPSIPARSPKGCIAQTFLP